MKILAIDDVPDNLLSLKAVLLDAIPGCELRTASNGAAGIEAARAEDPDVILMDIVMPGMDGFEACRRLKVDDTLRDIPVLFLTARTDRDSRIRALECGGEGFLSKPLDEQELLAQIRAMAKVKAANRMARMEKEELAALVGERTRQLQEELAERKKAQEEVVQSHELLDNLAAQVPGVIYQYRLYPDGHSAFPYSSPGMRLIYEFAPEDLWEDASPVFGRLHPEDHDRVSEAIFESARTLNTFYCEFRVILPGQGLRWRWSQAEPQRLEDGSVLWHGIILDTTARKQAEEAVRESQNLLQMVVEGTSDAVYVKDLEGRYVLFNSSAARLTGKRSEEVIGRNDTALFPPEQAAWLMDLDRKIMSGGKVTTLEERLTTASGQATTFLVTKGPMVDTQGKVTGLFGVAHDITERKRAEEALRESEERFRSVAEHSRTYTWEVDANGLYTYVSDAVSQILGYAPEEVAGKRHFYEWHPEKGRKEFEKAAFKAFARLESFKEFLNPAVAKDGRVVWLSTNGIAMVNDDGTLRGYRGNDTDITERFRAESALRESEEKFRLLAENMVDVVWTMSPEGRFTYVSPSVEKLRGYTAEEVLAQSPMEALTPGSLNTMLEALAEYIPQIEQGEDALPKTPVPFEIEQPRKDGSTVWTEVVVRVMFDAHGVFTGFLGVSRDISERKRAEAALRESEERFRLLVKKSSDIFGIINGDGTQRYISPAVERITGFSPEELTGKNFAGVIHPDDLERVQSLWEKTTGNPCGVFSGEYRHIHKTRGWVHLEAVGQSFLNDPSVRGVVVSERDITERKRSEAALRKSEELYRLLTENMSDVIWMVDKDFNTVYVSPSVEKMRGYTAAEAMAQSVEDIMTPESLAKMRAGLASRFDSETGAFNPESRAYEMEQIRRDGSTVWTESVVQGLVDAAGGFNGFMGVSRDITDRKAAEAELRESEEKHRALIAGLPDMVVRFDLEGRHLFASDNVEAVAGIPAAAFMGKTHRELGFSEELCRYLEASIRGVTETGKPYESEFSYDGPRGKRVFNWRLMPEHDGRGELRSVLSISRDITEHRRLEQEYERLFQEMLDGFALHEIICDELGAPVDYRFLAVNPAFERMTGLKGEEIVGRTVLEVLPDTEPRWIEVYGGVALSGKPTFFENYSAPLQKHFEVAAYRHAPGQFACIFTDVTERVRAEQEIRQFKTIFDTATMGAAIIDLNGMVTYANRSFVESHGYAMEEVLGKSFRIFHNGEQLAVTDRLFVQVVREGAFPALEVGHCRKDGTVFPMLMTGTLVRDTEGRPKCIASTAIDLSERKVLEEELRQAQKMESVGRLAGGVAHDFNNMLGVILGHAEMAMDQVDPEEPLHADLSEIRKAAERSANLTRQLLAFARRQTAMPKVLDLNETINDMLKMLQRLITEDVALEWKPGAELWRVKVDPSQIDQILANLCVNARDAISGVGVVTIATENALVSAAQSARIPESSPGEYVLLAVRDTGCGMDKETMAKVFEPFFTTKEVGRGTGLGLATVYGIVLQNKGFVEVRSEPGRGTTFNIYLPRHAAASGQSGTDVEKGAMPRGRGETVMVVEDEGTILRMARMMLERLGYTVVTATGPEEALELSAAHPGEIHLLMTDVVMPEMNGKDLADRLRAARPGMRCLYMSGYTADVIARHGVMDETVAFLQKPFQLKSLADAVRTALEE
ncbi:MAG: PAS domain S-box protein [Candidatus Hydrogenedentes bacterium]|nr:PAS domain S-box protein [Candidatus Hydrogenedentota bacterium]